jgi:hypothetical protein
VGLLQASDELHEEGQVPRSRGSAYGLGETEQEHLCIAGEVAFDLSSQARRGGCEVRAHRDDRSGP